MDLLYEHLKAHVKTELLNVIMELQDDANYTKDDAAADLLKLISTFDM